MRTTVRASAESAASWQECWVVRPASRRHLPAHPHSLASSTGEKHELLFQQDAGDAVRSDNPAGAEALGARGFGVLTTIDVRATMEGKLDIDFRPYTILGACNPQFAHKALQAEDKIGTMLPCNVVVQEVGGGRVEVAAVDPVASMGAVSNTKLAPIASEVRGLLKQVGADL